MDQAAGARYATGNNAGRIVDGCPVVVRYADDLVGGKRASRWRSLLRLGRTRPRERDDEGACVPVGVAASLRRCVGAGLSLSPSRPSAWRARVQREGLVRALNAGLALRRHSIATHQRAGRPTTRSAGPLETRIYIGNSSHLHAVPSAPLSARSAFPGFSDESSHAAPTDAGPPCCNARRLGACVRLSYHPNLSARVLWSSVIGQPV